MGKYTAILENERIFTIQDLITDLKQNNRLYSLYDMGVIDYNLYKGLNLILSYGGYNTDNTYNIENRYSHKELYKHLKANVLLWLQRSNVILKYNTLKKIVRYMWAVTDNNTERGNSLRRYYQSKYNYIPRQRVNSYNAAVLS